MTRVASDASAVICCNRYQCTVLYLQAGMANPDTKGGRERGHNISHKKALEQRRAWEYGPEAEMKVATGSSHCPVGDGRGVGVVHWVNDHKDSRGRRILKTQKVLKGRSVAVVRLHMARRTPLNDARCAMEYADMSRPFLMAIGTSKEDSTPFGWPVVPEVKMTILVSFRQRSPQKLSSEIGVSSERDETCHESFIRASSGADECTSRRMTRGREPRLIDSHPFILENLEVILQGTKHRRSAQGHKPIVARSPNVPRMSHGPPKPAEINARERVRKNHTVPLSELSAAGRASIAS